MSKAHVGAAGEILERFDKLYEFDREPVAADHLESARHFAGLFAGEHVGGTEFVIGALFVKFGASASDVVFGLMLGNFLAVLSWTSVCTPISVQTRLTLYWYLRRIAGPVVTALYNVLNAIMFCILSGAMITVAASAIRIPFGIGPQIGWYPNDPRFVLVVFGVGAVVIWLAILGFKRFAQFSTICSPWIFCIFFSGALAMLPGLAASAGYTGGIHSLADVWSLADKHIWIRDPHSQFGFWHVAAFAWICNLSMHVGLADMALMRYARHTWYGLFSALGMYLGHYLAWLCAGIMGAATAKLLDQDLSKLDAGAIAFQSLGVAGAIAVVVAGWTTSNPTLYRAGLALQAVTPGWPRWLVTLLAGIATVAVACSPFVFVHLLDLVALYGILLMPIGAIVAMEHWFFPRLGLRRFWASKAGLLINWPALAAWGAAVAASLALYLSGALHEFFLAIPIWCLTAFLYTTLSAAAGAKMAPGETEDLSAIQPAAKPGSSKPAGSKPADRKAESQAPSASATFPARAILRIAAGAIAVASFVACISLAIWVFSMGADGYAARLAVFKTWLLYFSLIHLATAAIWLRENERGKNGAQAT